MTKLVRVKLFIDRNWHTSARAQQIPRSFITHSKNRFLVKESGCSSEKSVA
jgi:hypothetical protein